MGVERRLGTVGAVAARWLGSERPCMLVRALRSLAVEVRTCRVVVWTRWWMVAERADGDRGDGL